MSRQHVSGRLRSLLAALLRRAGARRRLRRRSDLVELSFIDRACSRLVDTWKNGQERAHPVRLLVAHAVDLDDGGASRGERSRHGAAATAGPSRKPNGDTHTVFGLAFLRFAQEHRNGRSATAGRRIWGPRDGLQPGLGYTAMIVQRPDIANGIPFPAVLPLVSLRYGQATDRRDVHPEARRRHQPRQRALRLRARDPRSDARDSDRIAHEHPRRRRRRTRARAGVEDRAVAARREGVRRAGQRRHGARAGAHQRSRSTTIADLVAFATKRARSR